MCCNLLVDESGKVMRNSSGVGYTACSQFLYGVVEVSLKMSVAPKNVTVFSDSVFVDQEPFHETRRRLRVRKTDPDGFDAKDTEGGSTLGDPTSMCSWLPCLDVRGSVGLGVSSSLFCLL